MVKLSDLRLDHNKINILPQCIGKLINLKWLGLNNNKLTTLPDEIDKLKNLQYLGLSITRLKSLRILDWKCNTIGTTINK